MLGLGMTGAEGGVTGHSSRDDPVPEDNKASRATMDGSSFVATESAASSTSHSTLYGFLVPHGPSSAPKAMYDTIPLKAQGHTRGRHG